MYSRDAHIGELILAAKLDRPLDPFERELAFKQKPNGDVQVAECLTCGRVWDDAGISDITPTPAGRCPFEAYHRSDEDEEREEANNDRRLLRRLQAILSAEEWDSGADFLDMLAEELRVGGYPHESYVPEDDVPFITMLRKHRDATGIDEPLDTLTTARHHFLTSPAGSFYVKNFGGNAEPKDLAKLIDSEPLGSVTTHDHHALVIPYRKGGTPHLAEDGPLATCTTKSNEGVLRPQLAVEDCHYRTLKSHEHLAGQRFPSEYHVSGNEGQRTLQAGNAVAVNCGHFIGARVLAALS